MFVVITLCYTNKHPLFSNDVYRQMSHGLCGTSPALSGLFFIWSFASFPLWMSSLVSITSKWAKPLWIFDDLLTDSDLFVWCLCVVDTCVFVWPAYTVLVLWCEHSSTQKKTPLTLLKLPVCELWGEEQFPPKNEMLRNFGKFSADCEGERMRGREEVEMRAWTGCDEGRGEMEVEMKQQRAQTRTREFSEILRYWHGARETDRDMSEIKWVCVHVRDREIER